MGNPQSLQVQLAIPMIQRVAAAAAIGSTYTLVGSIFGSGVILLIIVSTLDQDVQISLDGVNDFMPVIAHSAIPLDIKSDVAAIPGWRGVYVKEIGNPTTGSLYVSGFQV